MLKAALSFEAPLSGLVLFASAGFSVVVIALWSTSDKDSLFVCAGASVLVVIVCGDVVSTLAVSACAMSTSAVALGVVTVVVDFGVCDGSTSSDTAVRDVTCVSYDSPLIVRAGIVLYSTACVELAPSGSDDMMSNSIFMLPEKERETFNSYSELCTRLHNFHATLSKNLGCVCVYAYCII